MRMISRSKTKLLFIAYSVTHTIFGIMSFHWHQNHQENFMSNYTKLTFYLCTVLWQGLQSPQYGNFMLELYVYIINLSNFV